MINPRLRIAVVTPIPTPYRDPFWNVVAQHEDVALDVFYCSAGKQDRPWDGSWKMDYHAEILRGRNLLKWRGVDASCYWNPEILRRLDANPYNAVVVGGYNHLTMLAAIRDSLRRRRPYFLMCESYQRQISSSLKQWVKDHLVNRVIGQAAGGFPTGKWARDYMLGYGAQPNQLTFIPNAPDVVKISEEVTLLRRNRDQLRLAHGLGRRPNILFIGRFIPKKGVHTLIQAFRETGISDEANLVLVGDGPQRQALESLAERLGIRERTHFVGFVQPQQMSQWLAMADLFVLPSSETWGVVVLEALASGVPVIITDEVGCGPDVLNDPLVGEAVPPRDVQRLAQALRERILNPVAPERVNMAWQPVYDQMRYANLAERMIKAISTTLYQGKSSKLAVSC